MKKLLVITFALLVPSTAFAQLQAPDEKAVVVAVRAAHPEINTCIEGERGAIVDWSAQRLNVKAGAVRWGRKGSTPTGGVKNTDALVYKRTDNRIEIYDVISGGAPCNISWQKPTRALLPGENGWWAPPQLGPESGGSSQPPPPPPPSMADDLHRIRELLELVVKHFGIQ